MVKVFIFGSCVSRDTCEVGKDYIEVVDYFARSSFASLASLPVLFDMKLIENITSPFQKKMVERDLNKSIFLELMQKEPDYYLVDLIDERFCTFEDLNGSIGTVSMELNNVLPNEFQDRKIQNNTDRYFELFEIGFSNFINRIADLSKLKIINAKWAMFNEMGNGLRFSSEAIARENARLNTLYTIIGKYVPKSCFIDIPEKFLVADSSHKWGEEPFHYTMPFYEHILCKLKTIK